MGGCSAVPRGPAGRPSRRSTGCPDSAGPSRGTGKGQVWQGSGAELFGGPRCPVTVPWAQGGGEGVGGKGRWPRWQAHQYDAGSSCSAGEKGRRPCKAREPVGLARRGWGQALWLLPGLLLLLRSRQQPRVRPGTRHRLVTLASSRTGVSGHRRSGGSWHELWGRQVLVLHLPHRVASSWGRKP